MTRVEGVVRYLLRPRLTSPSVPSSSLQTLLGKAASDKETRMIKVVIENEELQSGGVATAEGDEREDYDKCVLAALEEKVGLGVETQTTPPPPPHSLTLSAHFPFRTSNP
jgi:hypothetical protein